MSTQEFERRKPQAPTMTLEQFKAGDPEAILRALPYLISVARRFLKGKNDAEDLVQTTLTRAMPILSRRTPEDFKSTAGDILPYLRRATINTVISDFRKRRRRVTEVQINPAQESVIGDPSGDVEQAVFSRQSDIASVLRSDELVYFRETILLVYGDGYSYAEAAKELGVRVGTVKSRLNRGRKLVKAALLERNT